MQVSVLFGAAGAGLGGKADGWASGGDHCEGPNVAFLVGYKVARRTGDVEEFGFDPISLLETSATLAKNYPVSHLQARLCLWLLPDVLPALHRDRRHAHL
eukprot:SAG11_NODE_1055_length_6017_cov_1.548496_6_plen_100_part_00